MQYERWLALRVIDGNSTYGMSYVELKTDATGNREVIIEPYDGLERHSTVFHSGTIRIVRHPELKLIFE